MVKTSLSLYLDESLVEKLRRVAEKQGKSLAKVVGELIEKLEE